jgi:hypothetical protein
MRTLSLSFLACWGCDFRDRDVAYEDSSDTAHVTHTVSLDPEDCQDRGHHDAGAVAGPEWVVVADTYVSSGVAIVGAFEITLAGRYPSDARLMGGRHRGVTGGRVSVGDCGVRRCRRRVPVDRYTDSGAVISPRRFWPIFSRTASTERSSWLNSQASLVRAASTVMSPPPTTCASLSARPDA